MGIKSCKLVSDEAALEVPYKFTWGLVYDVDTDERTTAANVLTECFTASPDAVPRLYSAVGNGSYVTGIRVVRAKDTNASKFVVQVSTGDLPPGSDPANGSDPPELERLTNPLKRKVTRSIDFVTEQEIVTVDVNGNPIANGAGNPFTDPLTRERRLPVFVYRKNYATLDEIAAIQEEYENTSNSTPFAGRGVGQVAFQTITAGEQQFENGIGYYPAELRFVAKKEGWYRFIVDQGFQYWNKAKTEPDARLLNATDAAGQTAVEPVKLESNGTKRDATLPARLVGFNVLSPVDYGPLVADP